MKSSPKVSECAAVAVLLGFDSTRKCVWLVRSDCGYDDDDIGKQSAIVEFSQRPTKRKEESSLFSRGAGGR
jgi:hypothetical protein